jgi:predicted TIM-barrel enzyme
MTLAGADLIVAHMGLTTGGGIGAQTAKTIEQCAVEIRAIAEAARAVRNDVLVLAHGGPISSPQDAQAILSACPGVHGFYGASSMERLPVETAITRQVRDFLGLTLAIPQQRAGADKGRSRRPA